MEKKENPPPALDSPEGYASRGKVKGTVGETEPEAFEEKTSTESCF